MSTTHKVLSNSALGYTRASYKTRFVFNQATAATGSATFIVPYAGTVVGLYASAVCSQSSDRTDTISLKKRPQNVASGSEVNLLVASTGDGVISSNNVSGSITRCIGTSGITAFTGSTNPTFTATTANLSVVKGDTLIVTNTTAGANGSAATQLNVVVEIEHELGDTVADPLAGN